MLLDNTVIQMMKKILILALVVCSMAVKAAKENKLYNVKVGNETRKYLLYVPDNVKENAPFFIFWRDGKGLMDSF